MAVFLKSDEIKVSLGALVNYYVQDCNTSGEVPQELIELIKHNFLAKFVSFDKKTNRIEVGINQSKHRSGMYPNIKVHSYSLEETSSLIKSSFKTGKADLEFYGKLINAHTKLNSLDVVVV